MQCDMLRFNYWIPQNAIKRKVNTRKKNNYKMIERSNAI